MQDISKGNIIYTAFSDGYEQERDDIKVFRSDSIFYHGVMEAKRYKVLHHLFFPYEQITVWIDGNIKLNIDLDEAITKFLGNADIAIFKHPDRATVWDEFSVLRSFQTFVDKEWLQEKLKEQEEFYKNQGLPSDTPLYEGGFIIRRNTDKVNALMESWWAQICRWQWRDQVSLPYILWKYGQEVAISPISGNIRDHKYFTWQTHGL